MMAWIGGLVLVLAIGGVFLALGVGLIWNGITCGEPLLTAMGVPILLVVLGLSLVLWPEAFPPSGVKMITLRSDRWACAAAHVERTTTYVQTGKVMVPITTANRVCDQWNRLTA